MGTERELSKDRGWGYGEWKWGGQREGVVPYHSSSGQGLWCIQGVPGTNGLGLPLPVLSGCGKEGVMWGTEEGVRITDR